MVRKLRVEYQGAIYHVMNRSNRREPIFKDEADRQCMIQGAWLIALRFEPPYVGCYG